jgi:hypothetical protein
VLTILQNNRSRRVTIGRAAQHFGGLVKRALLAVGCGVAFAGALWVPASAAAAQYVGIGAHPWVVVLCNFSDDEATPHSQAYYQEMFSDQGVGLGGLLDYWHDVSFGQLSISGTMVTNWATARSPSNTSQTLTLAQFEALSNDSQRVEACADGADQAADAAGQPIDWSDYWGVIAITGVPTPGNSQSYVGQQSLQIGTGSYSLAATDLGPEVDDTVAAHEMGHGFGLIHSRALSTPTDDYYDCTDVMSAVSCVSQFKVGAGLFGDGEVRW